MPLVIPRRLTIPIIDEARWSKGYAVASACLSPILLTFLWSSQHSFTPAATQTAYTVASSLGAILGLLALIFTRRDKPPERFALGWVSAGFVMSIVWFYIIANELVALLVTTGVILQLAPSLLAFTILAWGNSLGDLFSNTTIAKANPHGVQIAISGCFAGPMFNTLIGLGVSLLLRSWAGHPTPYRVEPDGILLLSLGFLMLSLVWSLAVLTRTGMRPGRLLGFSLVAIYLTFLGLGAAIDRP